MLTTQCVIYFESWFTSCEPSHPFPQRVAIVLCRSYCDIDPIIRSVSSVKGNVWSTSFKHRLHTNVRTMERVQEIIMHEHKVVLRYDDTLVFEWHWTNQYNVDKS